MGDKKAIEVLGNISLAMGTGILTAVMILYLSGNLDSLPIYNQLLIELLGLGGIFSYVYSYYFKDKIGTSKMEKSKYYFILGFIVLSLSLFIFMITPIEMIFNNLFN